MLSHDELMGVVATEAVEAVAAQPNTETKDAGKCEWKYDDLDCFYETKCGEAYCFTDGDRKQNKYRHCPNCGKEIYERK